MRNLHRERKRERKSRRTIMQFFSWGLFFVACLMVFALKGTKHSMTTDIENQAPTSTTTAFNTLERWAMQRAEKKKRKIVVNYKNIRRME